MAKIKREKAIDEALDLLNEVGLDGVTTRRLAQRLGVESATLYWHFKNKEALLSEMAACVLDRHHLHAVPPTATPWRDWLAENGRSFRRALLACRDGARLHAGTRPDAGQMERIAAKLAYLVSAGIPERDAAMTLYSLGQFTIGCVLEEQARQGHAIHAAETALEDAGLSAEALHVARMIEADGSEAAFEFGMGLLLDGLQARFADADAGQPRRGSARRR